MLGDQHGLYGERLGPSSSSASALTRSSSLVQVIVVASGHQDQLRLLNAQMRRIDLMCKLFGPLCIALAAGYSTSMAITLNLVMNLASIPIEYFAIQLVYRANPALQEPKAVLTEEGNNETRPSTQRYWICVLKGLNRYIHHPAFLPSFAGALLYFTVLSFAAQMVTWLLSMGFSSVQIGLARTLSVLFEVSATWISPYLAEKIGSTRTGLWSAAWQTTSLGVGTALFVSLKGKPLWAASALVTGTIVSRVGLRSFDLCVQSLVQDVRFSRPLLGLLLLMGAGCGTRLQGWILVR